MSAAEIKRAYSSARWQKRAKAQKAREPFCRYCERRGILNDGTKKADGSPQNTHLCFLVADHIEPHHGDPAKFWGGALQTLCFDDSQSAKAKEERLGYSLEIGADGWPVDPRHPLRG